MTHQEELCSRTKNMLSAKFWKNDPETEFQESGNILVTSDCTLLTNDKGIEISPKLEFYCRADGLKVRCILDRNAPASSLDQLAAYIMEVNSNRTNSCISCFELDDRDGEIASRCYLACESYVPSVAMIYTVTRNAMELFMAHGEQLLERMGLEKTAVVQDSSQKKDLLDEALAGETEAQQLLLAFIGKDPDSEICERLKNTAGNGNAAAQKLLRQHLLQLDVMGRFEEIRPRVPSLEEVYQSTANLVSQYLNQNRDLEEWDFYAQCLRELAQVRTGNLRAAVDNEGHFFANDKLPGLANPQMAYNLLIIGLQLLNQNTWMCYSGLHGDLESVRFYLYDRAAQMLILFGTPAQQRVSLELIWSYHEHFKDHTGGRYDYPDHRYRELIRYFMGLPGSKAFQNGNYDLSAVADHAWAVRMYQQLIDRTLQSGTLSEAKTLASEFEPRLGVEYFASVEQQSASSSGGSAGTGSSGGCYIATCVYGSYDCPEVWTLRRYRDNVLAQTALGRLFIRTYYAVSPTIVRTLGRLPLMRTIWKKPLDAWVEKLNEEGYSDRPYSD